MFNLGFVSKDNDKHYLVKCRGPCNNVEVKLTCSSGDPDLYLKPVRRMKIANEYLVDEVYITIFQTLGCEDDSCYLCKSTDTGLADKCSGISTQASEWVQLIFYILMLFILSFFQVLLQSKGL